MGTATKHTFTVTYVDSDDDGGLYSLQEGIEQAGGYIVSDVETEVEVDEWGDEVE